MVPQSSASNISASACAHVKVAGFHLQNQRIERLTSIGTSWRELRELSLGLGRGRRRVGAKEAIKDARPLAVIRKGLRVVHGVVLHVESHAQRVECDAERMGHRPAHGRVAERLHQVCIRDEERHIERVSLTPAT